MDHEVEIAIIVGSKARYVKEEEAEKFVLGYCICNDISEREWQKNRGGQWVKGKSGDTFGPLGPYLVTKDEIKDPLNLNLSLDLNGKRRQTGNTSFMIFNFNFLISHISQFITLMPGDIITTGTPAGVPVVIMSPGINVINWLMCDIRKLKLKIIKLVLPVCLLLPLRSKDKFKLSGSFISSLVTR